MTMDDEQRLERLAIASLRMEPCPDAERLAAYAARTLSGMDQLLVDAHVRRCPLCTRDLELSRPPDLDQRWQLDERPPVRQRFAIAQPLEQLFGVRLRAEHGRDDVRQYLAADVALSVTITPTAGERWRITGQITRANTPLAERAITLRSARRRYQRETDVDGFFTFEDVPAGRYTLSTIEDSVYVQIRDLTLTLSD